MFELSQKHCLHFSLEKINRFYIKCVVFLESISVLAFGSLGRICLPGGFVFPFFLILPPLLSLALLCVSRWLLEKVLGVAF